MSHQRNPRVLVVDDCRNAADSLAMMVTLWGYDAEACYGGLAALAVAGTYRPHVVVLDVGMPGTDGFQVALGLREMPGLAATLIIGITAHDHDERHANARNAGFDQCLAKPVSTERLRELIAGAAPLRVGSRGPRRHWGALTVDGGRTRKQLVANRHPTEWYGPGGPLESTVKRSIHEVANRPSRRIGDEAMLRGAQS